MGRRPLVGGVLALALWGALARVTDYTAAADATYGDPAVCAPPVIQHVDDETRNIHGHCGRDYRDQVLCGVTLSKP